MSTHRHIDKICCAALCMVILLTLVLVNAKSLGVQPVSAETGYETRLFDTSKVHTIDIEMEGWDSFIDTCENEEYSECSIVIDDETYKNVGIRAKGNTSLSSVSRYGNDRYSFKIEFDCYDNGKSYHGLDKISLNNIIQDNTYMKDYLCYQMMNDFGVAAPLCSYAYITVNGEEWGLYLAVEAVEESFLFRNYGNDYGNLYKPDSMDMGGGRGNGGRFDGEAFGGQRTDEKDSSGKNVPEGFVREENMEPDGMPEGEPPQMGDIPQEQENERGFGKGEQPGGGGNEPPEGDRVPPGQGEPKGDKTEQQEGDFRQNNGRGKMSEGSPGMGGMPGSDDVSLIYSDDDYESYRNIFDNAKTNITDSDRDRLITSLKKLNAGEELEKTVDISQVIRYFVVHNFVCNFDSYTGSMIHNYYLYEKDGKLSMIPWDYNLAFGAFEAGADAEGMINYPIDDPVSGGNISSRPMLSWIFENEEYTEMYHTYFQELMETYFESGYFTGILDTVSRMITPYVEKDSTKFCSYEEFRKGISTLKRFCLLRAQSVGGQLDGTIPSTKEGQKADDAVLVDSEGLVISDMGSMGQLGTGYF